MNCYLLLCNNSNGVSQWRTQKLHGGFHSVVYDAHLQLVCVICDVIIWRHIHVSKPTF